MAACNKTAKLKTSDGKIIQYKEQSDLAFMLLIKSQVLDEPLDLDELLTYSLFPVPYIFATADGFLRQRCSTFYLRHTRACLIILTTVFILKMVMLWFTFSKLICLMILDQMVHKNNFVFSTDSYHPDSIKSQERLRRGTS